MYLERFNLSPASASLLKLRTSAAVAPAGPKVRWGNYCRAVLKPLAFYAFEKLNPGLYCFIGAHQSLPGRAERAVGDAIGRSLAVAWFEKVEDTGEGTVVTRISKEQSEMVLSLQTPAEILRVAVATCCCCYDYRNYYFCL